MIRFPAEWEKQSAVLIAWPHDSGDFSKQLPAVETCYQFIADTISQYQRLLIVCRDDHHQQHIQGLVNNTRMIDFMRAEVNDIWVRDTLFLSVENQGRLQLLNFRFNGWGKKYAYQKDDALNHTLIKQPPFKGADCLDIDFILEGGSVESDGAGTLMTTRQCLLNPNRNAALSEHDIERQLVEHLGAKRILWIDQNNLSGDDTDAHIDTLARFCAPDTIAYTSCDDPSDPHYADLKNMEAQLQAFRTQSNTPYRLVPLPMPKAIFDQDGCRLPANYANFLIINGAVMVPTYVDAMDETALQRLGNCFPQHNIIATPCRPIVHQYGSLHCMTMQFPEHFLTH